MSCVSGRCAKGSRCLPCIEKDTPEIFDGGKTWPENVLQAFEAEKPDLCVCGPVTRAQGVCECGADE